jgi:mannose-6-phosphate isomerase-like protein (cupin superfamily)
MTAVEPHPPNLAAPLTAAYIVGQKEKRDWGWYEVMEVTPLSCTKTIVISPQQALSLQSHARRSEQWSVLDGMLTVIVGEELRFARPGDKPTEVPVGVLHAMINCTDKPVKVKEVQTGRCEESDIVRYRDPHGRPCVATGNHLPTLKSLCLYDAILACLKK